MNDPVTRPAPTRALSGGVVLRRDGAPSERAAAAFDREIARLLRSRLIIATGILLVAAFTSLLFGQIGRAEAQGLTHPGFVPIYALLAGELVLLLVLLRQKASLRLLRWLEAGVFGGAALGLALAQFRL